MTVDLKVPIYGFLSWIAAGRLRLQDPQRSVAVAQIQSALSDNLLMQSDDSHKLI